MTVRLAADADWPRIVQIMQAFFSAHPEAWDGSMLVAAIERGSIDAPGSQTFVFDNNGTVQASITMSRDGDTLCVLVASYDPSLSAQAVKTRADQFAQQLINAATARGMTHLHGFVMKAYTAGVNYWRNFGLLESVQTRQTPNGEAWEATVTLARFGQGVA